VKTIHIAAENRLPDEGNWINRFRVKSSSSSSIYIVAQDRVGRWWGCGCRGWINRPEVRNCRHLKDLGIPGGKKPIEIRIEAGGNPMTAEDTARTAPAKIAPTRLGDMGKRKIEL
jgi:hypothetical protein